MLEILQNQKEGTVTREHHRAVFRSGPLPSADGRAHNAVSDPQHALHEGRLWFIAGILEGEALTSDEVVTSPSLCDDGEESAWVDLALWLGGFLMTGHMAASSFHGSIVARYGEGGAVYCGLPALWGLGCP